MPSTGSYHKSLIHLYVGFSVVTVIAIGVAVWALIHLRHEAESRAVTNTQNLAVSLEQTIEGKIDTLDMALLSSVDEISQQMAGGNPDQQSVTRFLIKQQKRLPHLNLLSATNEKGETIYGKGVPTPPSSIADRDYFARLRDNPDSGLVIAKPIIGKISHKWLWLFARSLGFRHFAPSQNGTRRCHSVARCSNGDGCQKHVWLARHYINW